MNADTEIDRARARVRAEQSAVDESRDALEAFGRRVRDVPADPTPTATTGMTTVAGPREVVAASDDGCGAVRAAFAETVDSYTDDGSLLASIRAEFTESIAMALAPTTDVSFTPELKELIVTEADTRRAEQTALTRALDREAAQLDEASATVAEIVDWIADADETPLGDLGFDRLRSRHETLARHRTRCDRLVDRRQEFLDATTGCGAAAGVSHRQLVPTLYDDGRSDHPVLATATRLEECCRDCQRTVRAHLVRRA